MWTIPSAVLLLLGGALAWVSYEEYHETIEREYRFLDVHARVAQNKVADLVHDVRQTLARAAEEFAAAAPRQRAAYAARLAEYRRDLPDVRMLVLLDPAGRVRATTDPDLAGFDAAKRDYFTAHQEGPQRFDFHISRPYRTLYGDYAIGFSLPILDGDRRLLGIVAAGIHYGDLANVMQDVQPAESHSTAAILNDDGDFLFHLPQADASVGKSAAANQAFRAFLAGGRTTTMATAVSPADGVKRVYAIRPVDDTPLSVAVSLPLRDVLAPWRRHLLLRSLLFAFGAAFVLQMARTAQRRQREALAGKELAERLISTANAMMVVVDADGRILTANEAAERITGFRRDDLVGRSAFETFLPRERFPRAWQAFVRYRESGEVPRAFETPILTRGGEERVVAWQNSALFADGEAPVMLSFGIDVTERTQLQQMRNREEISRRLVGIQEEERRRLAVELHDRTSPNLTVLDINLKLLAGALPKGAPAELADLIEDTSATLADTIASIRSVSFDFRPPLLDYAGLWPALSAYARQFSRRTGITVRLAEQDSVPSLAPEVETNLFRIAQEALTNCARHSHAERVAIALAGRDGGGFVLTISDDGVGFDPHGEWETGLVMMRQRAAFIGGRLELDTRPGEGTCVTVAFGAEAMPARDVPRAIQPRASHASAPSPAARPLAQHAVSR